MARADADANLLFGLLALQNGLVDQDQLLSAFRSWTRDKSRPMAEHLVARGGLDGSHRALIEALVEAHVQKHSGDTGKSLAALGAGARVPAGLAALGDPDLDASLGHAGTRASGEGASDRTRSLTPEALGGGQRFHVLRPHARGGLGAVFVALDGELRREVALKQILDQHADDPNSRTRFVMEAEITGGLEHPGIVPVYGLGTYADGRPFYAMRFIRGDSLKEAVTAFHADEALRHDPGRRSLALRQLLRRFIDVCNAIAYAHGRGVLHRDIKPANVVLGAHGETLVVDWGLAKALGRPAPGEPGELRPISPSASGSVETLPGSALGTPAYMSPEQAAGDLDRLGPAADVYSLGATLYTVLTGKPPFSGDDVGAVLRAVQKGEFPPPRDVEPATDRALEAVCLKAMARRPEDRYVSPRELADDVERWAADEPVSARAEPLAERARRWARRHRTAMAAAAAALLVAIAGLSAVLAVKARDNRRLAEAYERERRANVALAAANERERARLDLALDAIRTFHTGVSTDVLLKRKEFAELRAKLLGGAKSFYDKLQILLRDQPDRRSREALGDAYFEVGELVAAVGTKQDALAAYEQSHAIRAALLRDDPASAAYRHDLAATLNNIANLRQQAGRRAEALAAYEAARATEESLVKEHPRDAAYRERLARILNNLGLRYRADGRPDDALRALEQSRSIRAGLVKERPRDPAHRADLAVTLSNLGLSHRQDGRPAEARGAWEEALGVLETLARESPQDPASRDALIVTLNQLADLDLANGRVPQALTAWSRARGLCEDLVREHPNETAYQLRLGGCLLNLGVVQMQTGALGEAQASYDRARECYEKLVAADPGSVSYRQDLALSLNNAALLSLSNGRLAEAHQAFDRARAIREALVNADPASAAYRRDLAVTLNGLGHVLRASGRPAEALAAYGRGRDIWESLVKDEPATPAYRHRLALALHEVGLLLSAQGRTRDAVAALARATDLWSGLLDADPSASVYGDRLADCSDDLVGLLTKDGRFAEALTPQDRVRTLWEARAASHPGDAADRLGLASALQRSAVLQESAGRPADAAASLRRAVSLREGLPAATGAAWFEQALARARLGALAAAAGAGVTESERQAALDGAMTDLRRAVAAGFRGLDEVRAARVLDPLRSRPEFAALLRDLAFPTDPFARPR
jgi:serine/threonine-protein kinase